MASQSQLLEQVNAMPQSLHGLYAITDENLLAGPALFAAVEEALRAGLALLQYRNKSYDWTERCTEAAELAALCRRYDTPLLINDDVDLCLEVGADGVHLGQSDTKLREARQRLGENGIIGITCHSDLILAQRAEAAGADYVAFGRFFPSLTKPNAPAASIEVLRQAKAQLTIPIVAIGGINAENGEALVMAGADMLAVINTLFASPDVAATANALNALFRSTPNTR